MTGDDLGARLSRLPARDASPAAATRILRQSLAVLARERALSAHPRRAALIRAWGRILEPALAAGAVAVYLGWMVRTLMQF